MAGIQSLAQKFPYVASVAIKLKKEKKKKKKAELSQLEKEFLEKFTAKIVFNDERLSAFPLDWE